jgi:chromosome partitioning protein
MFFAFANPKGGVGKSTLSVHAAVWLCEQGKNVAVVDADVQGSSSAWLEEAAPKLPLVRLITADDILEELPKLREQFEHVVIDGPAGLSEVTRAILLLTDVALLPCGPSVLDLRAAFEAIRAVRQVQSIRHGPPHAVLVPNGLKTRQRLSKDFVDATRALDIPASSGLRDLQAYADSVGQGTVVWKMGPRAADAAAEIKQLFMEVLNDEFTDKEVDDRRVENA